METNFTPDKGVVTIYGANQQIPVDVYQFFGVNCTIALPSEQKKPDADPSDCLAYLDLVPNRGIVEQLVALKEPVPGMVHLLGDVDCLTENSRLILINPKKNQATTQALLHGWAHIAYKHCDVEARIFYLACSIEAPHVSENDLIEEWSELLAELLLEDSLSTAQHIARIMPLRACALMLALQHELDSASDGVSPRARHFELVVQKMREIAIPRANVIVSELIDEAGAEQDIALRLFFQLGLSDTAALSNLSTINLSFEPLSEAKLSLLQFAGAAERVDLSGTGLTRDGLSVVKGLRAVKEIRAAHTDVRNLNVVQTLPSVTRLDVSSTPVSDNDLVPLRQVSNLQFIDLRNTSVTERGLKTLRDFNPNIDIIA